MPSRISTFLGIAEDLSRRNKHKQKLKRQKENPLKETKGIIESDKHILLPIRTKSQLSILSMAPTNAGGISTNKMVHIT
jgi:hypothetical protein